MKRFVILAAVLFACASTASPLKAEQPAKDQTLAVRGPCEVLDCSSLPEPMAKALKDMPGTMSKAMENFKLQDLKFPGCDGGKCPFELPAEIFPRQVTPCKEGKC